MVNYNHYMGTLRKQFVPQKCISVQLPPVKDDCTCVVNYSLSLMNSPVEYCTACDNKGYIETSVVHDMTGSVVDFASDTNRFPNALMLSEGGDFDKQQYVIHAVLSECEVEDYNYQNCFDLSKQVVIDAIDYSIISIDKSTLLGQIKVIINKKIGHLNKG